MAGAGFAAGFFSEATNIMRERDKRTREDELIAKELQQKDADWARNTQHDVDMATLNYTLTTSAARNKKVEEVTAARNLYVQAGGDPTALDKLIVTDPVAASLHIERSLAIKDANGLNQKAFHDLTSTVGVEGVTDETATTYKSEIGAGSTSTEAAFNSYAMEERLPPKPMKKDEIEFVSKRLTSAALETASRRKNALNAATKTNSALNEDFRILSQTMDDAQKFGSNTALMQDVGVKAVYDTMDSMGQAGYDIRQHPDILSNPEAAQKALTISNYTTFMGNPIESPYEAASIFESMFETGEIDPTQEKVALDDFVESFSVDFLPDSLLVKYYEYTPIKPKEE